MQINIQVLSIVQIIQASTNTKVMHKTKHPKSLKVHSLHS